VKLCDPSLTCAIPERLRDEQLTVKHYTNNADFTLKSDDNSMHRNINIVKNSNLSVPTMVGLIISPVFMIKDNMPSHCFNAYPGWLIGYTLISFHTACVKRSFDVW